MAAVTKGTVKYVTPAGMGFTDRGQAATDMLVGDLLIIATTTPNTGFEKVYQKAPVSTVDPAGIVIQDCKAGEPVNVGVIGELEGYTGLTPGAPLYSSPSVVGGIDTVLVTGAIGRVRAVSTTRIRFNFG
jgi:hypothetical protein